MNLLKRLTVFALIFGLAAHATDDMEPGKRLDDLFKRLVSSNHWIHQAAILELATTDSKEVVHNVTWLVRVHRQGIFESTQDKGYEFATSTNSHSYSDGYSVSNGVVYRSQRVEENRKMVAITQEVAKRSLVALGDQAVNPLMDQYTKSLEPDLLNLLSDIARSQKHGEEKTAAESAKSRKRIYTFLSESYMKLANDRE